ncbi:MAG: type II secretion system protein [Planctomycetota bacterium]|jgi:prepilin-type N-terminal cleavage/methylation domain-containing protein
MMMKKHGAGFTLVELLVVIGIIVLLAGLIFPQITKAKRKAERVECLNFLRQIGMAATEYLGDDETHLFPWAGEDATATEHLNLLVADGGYGLEPKMFICKAASKKRVAVMDEDRNYTLSQVNNTYAWTGEPLSESDEPSEIIGSDGGVRDGEGDNNHADGMNTLRVDGAVEWIKMTRDEKKKLPEGLVLP